MMNRKKIAIVTGSRADYGLLYWLMKGIMKDPNFDLYVIVTGMHCSPEFGLTYKEIQQDGFEIFEKVEMLQSSDTPEGVAKSIGLGIIGFSNLFNRHPFDLLVLLGDRFEILAAAEAALVANIPIAHIGGGDSTEGVIDEAIRHSITKMAHLHFVTNNISFQRVRQLGENPNHIFNVGHLGIDQIKKTTLFSRKELENILDFSFNHKNLLITFHPVTLNDIDQDSTPKQFQALLSALHQLDEIGLIFTKSNADTNGRIINQMVDHYVSNHPNAKAFINLGQQKYLSVMAQVDMVIGNSSSGIYEAPFFKIPTVNIGDRQRGRIMASSIIQSQSTTSEIIQSIQKAYSLNCSKTINPFGEGNTSEKIIKILKNFPNYQRLIKKRFYSLNKVDERDEC